MQELVLPAHSARDNGLDLDLEWFPYGVCILSVIMQLSSYRPAGWQVHYYRERWENQEGGGIPMALWEESWVGMDGCLVADVNADTEGPRCCFSAL